MSETDFIKTYDTLSDALFRHCYIRVYERERARDLVQEAFTRTWGYLARGERIENMKAFLYRVVNNLIIDEARKKRVISLDALNEEGFEIATPTHEAVKTAAEIGEILRVLDRLDEKSRGMIVMRYVDGLGPKDIAAIIGGTENAVSVRLHRAVAELREFIQSPSSQV